MPFDFQLDRDACRLTIVMRGFWSAETMDGYEAMFPAQLRALKALGGKSACLVDGSGYAVQSKDIMARHEVLLASTRELWADRVAVVAPDGLTQMQAKRVVSSSPFQTFGSVAEAESWLASSST